MCCLRLVGWCCSDWVHPVMWGYMFVLVQRQLMWEVSVLPSVWSVATMLHQPSHRVSWQIERTAPGTWTAIFFIPRQASSIHATKLRNNFLATTIAKKYESTSAMKRKRVQGDCNNNYSACLPSLHILLLIDCSIGSSDWSFDLAVGHHQC